MFPVPDASSPLALSPQVNRKRNLRRLRGHSEVLVMVWHWCWERIYSLRQDTIRLGVEHEREEFLGVVLTLLPSVV